MRVASAALGALGLLCAFATVGIVGAEQPFTSGSPHPEVPWLLLAALIAATFVVGLTLSAIMRRRRGLSFF